MIPRFCKLITPPSEAPISNEALARQIEITWANCGHPSVRVWVSRRRLTVNWHETVIDDHGQAQRVDHESKVVSEEIESNLRNGLPPR